MRVIDLLGFKAGCLLFFTLLSFCNLAHGQDPDSCNHWRGWISVMPQDAEEYRLQYDTLRHYVESCAKDDNAAYLVFSHLGDAVDNYDLKDTTRYRKFREWLISVLYINTTSPKYFCECIRAIGGTYRYDNIPHPRNAYLAILKYLLSIPACNYGNLQQQYDQTLVVRHEEWLKGDTTVPEDTTLPTLKELGLDFLLHSDVQSPGQIVPLYIASFTSSPNPFKDETRLRFHLNRTSYVSIEITDLLGRVVWESKGRTYDEGDHEISVDAKELPEGTLYARISTGFGEVKTVKLIKQ